MGLHSWKSESRVKQCATERFPPSLPLPMINQITINQRTKSQPFSEQQ